MGHDHVGSAGASSAAGQHSGRLAITLCLSGAILIAQVIGGWLSGSLALLADAGHTLADILGVSLALMAIAWARRPAPATRTFGRYRVEILAAAVNGVLLLVVCAYVLVESWHRWADPAPIETGVMLAVAAGSVVANLVGLLLLRRGAGESLTVRGAYLEVLGDLWGSAGVVAAALVIAWTGWLRADVVASVAIALLIIPRALSLLRDAWHVLAEGAPPGIDMDEVRAHIREVPGVIDVHDLHAWVITSGMPVLSAHVVVAEEALADGFGARILDQLGDCLRGHFDVSHCTFQLEPPGHREHEPDQHA